jgi:hypothetical protein
MEKAIELFVAIHSLIIGLSHIFQPHAWIDFFRLLRSKGHAGVFANGFLCLWFGTVIVVFHPVWTGWPLVITLLGWAQVLKGAICFVIPQWGLRSMSQYRAQQPSSFIVGGVILLAISGLCWYLTLS